MDIEITLGYLYYLNGDYSHASQQMNEVIRSGKAVGAVINTVRGYYIIARMYAIQGLLSQSYELYHQAAQWINETGEKHLGASSVIDVGMADVLYEWHDLNAALVHVRQGLALIPSWGKADDTALAYITLTRIQLALGNRAEAAGAVEKATQLVQNRGVFSEARNVLAPTPG